jgi:uncharacterized lipoprotein YddW (UPF0748 family)
MKYFLTLPLILILSFSGCSTISWKQDAENTPNVCEERGIWLNRTELFLPREKLLKLLDDLSDANFTSIYVNTYFRGSVIYPDSKYLPLFPDASEKDILKWLLPEINKRGMRAEAWMEYGFYAYYTPDATKTEDRGVFLNKNPELTAVDSDDLPYIHNKKWGDFHSLCPANPKSHKLLANVCIETLKRYPFDGINLDRIRFPNENFCFCDYCRKNFKKDTGVKIEKFSPGSPEYNKFIEWKMHQLGNFIKIYVPEFRKARKGITVSLAALPPDMMYSHAQPWNKWLEKGYLDAAMPMLYGADNFEKRVKKIMQYPCSDRIYCGVDAHGLSPEQIIKQINFLKSQGAKGSVIWYSGKVADDLPLLKKGPYSVPAVSPLNAK